MINKTSKIALCAVLGATLSAGVATAGIEGRISGRVLDEAGKPLQGAQVVLVNPQSGAEEAKTADKKGKVAFLVIDATLTYGLRVSMDGYQSIQEQIRPKVGSTLRKEWRMLPQAGADAAPTEIVGKAAAIRLYNAGATANNEGDRETARAKFEEAVSVDPEFVAGYQALIGLCLAAGDHEKTLEAAESLLAIDPNDSMGLGARYDALLELGRAGEAAAALERMLVAAPGPATAVRLFNRGATKLRDGDVETAIPDLKQAIELDPELDVARSALATVYMSQKQFAEAEELALILRERKPEDAVALSLLYDAYVGQGKSEEAGAVFAELQKISPEKAAQAFYNQGVALLDQGKASDALASFQKALAADPEHVKVHYMLGLAYLNTSKMDLAKSSLEKFLDKAPDDPDAAAAREMLSALQ